MKAPARGRGPATLSATVRSRGLRPALQALVAAVVVVALGVYVFPTRTYLAQREAIAEASHELEVLREQQAALDEAADRLRDDAEIERRAREQHNLVRPGEEAYALLPAPGQDATRTAPLGGGGRVDEGDGILDRAWDAVTRLF